LRGHIGDDKSFGPISRGCFFMRHPSFGLLPSMGEFAIELSKHPIDCGWLNKGLLNFLITRLRQMCSSMPHRSRLNLILTKSLQRFSGNGPLLMRRKMATWSPSLTCTSQASGTCARMETTTAGFQCPTRMTQPNIDEGRRMLRVRSDRTSSPLAFHEGRSGRDLRPG